MSKGYIVTEKKSECYGCEACAQSCPKSAICMKEDEEGFRYPVIDKEVCVRCGICEKVCPCENMPELYGHEKYVFGGYIKDPEIRERSTSGGAFSAIVDAWCDQDYVIFGAVADGLEVYHTCITDKRNMSLFQKSKYSQSRIGASYADAKRYLEEGRKILFSGTPCQIAGLRSFFSGTDTGNLLTVEVVCEGVPSPLYMRKYNEWCVRIFGASVENLDYRYKDRNRWDFEVMLTKLQDGRSIKRDRWFNPFWSIWIAHLMSRPSCYGCAFAKPERGADITLGDLWGVHLYCPELYGHNKGASLVVCNTEKGRMVMKKAEHRMYGHELDFEIALKYQGPMRRPISPATGRDACMEDLMSDMDYISINKKWTKKPSVKLLWQKYVWGNRQKVWVWSILRRRKGIQTDH